MSANTTKRKRAAPTQAPISPSQSNIISSLLDCYDFLATNEYSEKTIGIQSFLMRKSVGDINFSEIIDDSEKRNRQGHNTNFVGILEDKRLNLPEIDASVEKCLMLTRLITYIQENETRFTSLISDVRIDMQYKMTDNQNVQNPPDFRKREHDFNIRKNAQEIRRLFYHSHDDAKQPQNLVYLQNRTTEQLTYIIAQMSRDSKSRQAYISELEAIFRTSFIIVAQPHSGVNPVTIYERKGPGEYTAKVSVVIISLLHDFMQTHPNLIELYDIEPSLCPASQYYKLEEPRSLSWKLCHLQAGPSSKPRTFLYAELTAITIEQSSKTDTRVRFAQLLHSFKFAIKLQLHLADINKPPIYQFALETLQFSIGAHNNQIPQLLTRVIIDDIRRFSKVQPTDVKIIQNYMQRYFIHRTGVQPNECVQIYLEQELTKASSYQKTNSQSLEDIYLDFLVNFVHQVEFMAKHPILAMFHADGLFLGICNSERAAEAIVQSSISGSPVIGLRFNSIRIDYNTLASAPPSHARTVKLPPCAIRVDIYNDRTKKLQNRTFDSSVLANDISKFVTSANTEDPNRIHILSKFDDKTNLKNYVPFTEFAKYYNQRLQHISKSDEKYKPVTDLVDNATDGNTEDDSLELLSQNPSGIFPFSPNSIPSLPPMTPSGFDSEHSSDVTSVHDYMSIPYDSSNTNVASPRNILSPSDRLQQQQQQQPQQVPYANNPEAILQYLLSQPNIAEQVARQFGIYNAPSSMESSQQILQQPQVQYQTQPLPYQQQIPIQIPQQRQSPQLSFPQPSAQPMYHQQQPQIYQQGIPQQQMFFPQQQPQILYQQKRRTSPSVIHYLPNNTNQPSSSSTIQQIPQFQILPTNGTNNMPQQVLEQMNFWTLSDGNLNQSTISSTQQQITTDQKPINIDQEFQQIIDDLINHPSTEINN